MIILHPDQEESALDEKLKRDARRLIPTPADDAVDRIMQRIPPRRSAPPRIRRDRLAWAILGSAAAAVVAIGPAGALVPDETRSTPDAIAVSAETQDRGPLVAEAKRLAAAARSGWARFRRTLPRPPRIKG